MNWYKIFYWISIAEKLQTLFIVVAGISTGLMALILIGSVVNMISSEVGTNNADYYKSFSKFFKRGTVIFLPLMIVFWMLYILTPSRTDTILIVAGGAVGQFITSDSSAKKLPSDLTYFLRAQIQELTAEAKVKMNQEFTPDTLANKSKDELIEIIKQKKN